MNKVCDNCKYVSFIKLTEEESRKYVELLQAMNNKTVQLQQFGDAFYILDNNPICFLSHIVCKISNQYMNQYDTCEHYIVSDFMNAIEKLKRKEIKSITIPSYNESSIHDRCETGFDFKFNIE